MRWFKHDSSANRDSKIKRLRNKYGIVGYGLYWYCLELIADKVCKNNATFELEDDAELIAEDWGLDQLKVQEMMFFMVDVGLFNISPSSNRIMCLKMASRLDEAAARNPDIRSAIKKFRNCPDIVPTMSGECPDSVPTLSRTDKIRLDQTRLDQNRKLKTDLGRREISRDMASQVDEFTGEVIF